MILEILSIYQLTNKIRADYKKKLRVRHFITESYLFLNWIIGSF